MEQGLADTPGSCKVAAARLDVVSSEPINEDNPLRKAKNYPVTLHISGAPIG